MQEKRYMNVMVVGGGGREHAIIKTQKKIRASKPFTHCPATAASLPTRYAWISAPGN